MSKLYILKASMLFTGLLCFKILNAQQNTSPENSLNSKEQSLVIISSLTATGNLEKLKVELSNGLDAGLSINEIKEALVQLYAYCGFPRSLNAINTFRAVLDERKSRGIKDVEGREILLESYSGDNYERGRKVLEELTKTSQLKPAPGFGEFAPRIDAFLKEHLFADIFERDVLNYVQRELVTISVISAIGKAEPMLRSHLTICLKQGLTSRQLQQFVNIIKPTIGKKEAKSAQKVLDEVLKNTRK